jgi:hypothetical protein
VIWVFACYFLWAVVTHLRAEWFMVCPPNPPGKLRHTWFVAHYDMWIGTYLHQGPDKRAYWFPIPCVGIKYWRAGDPPKGR